ncbi:MAG: BlaI/MecI/CopY family transcriptional regulator [Acidimicrobiales bacterium]
MNQLRRLAMGELEAAVMGVLWDTGHWQTAGEVHDRISPVHPVAYTTVMTILVRLWQKGRLERRRSGRAFSYQPVMTRDEDAARRMGEVLAGLADRSGVLNHFVETLPDHDRAELRRLLSARRRPR